MTEPVRLYCGEALAVLRGLPSGSVQTCVTSPPFYGLRDYGHADQIGLEPTPAEYVARLVEVFGEVRRVLRDDGTLWLNLGDSYASSGAVDRRPDNTTGNGGAIPRSEKRTAPTPDGCKPKDLLGIPWRVAFALQAAGWYLRQDIIWSKPNPMPESVRDRCTKSHEFLFLLSKQARYFFDADAIREPSERPDLAGATRNMRKNGASETMRGDIGREDIPYCNPLGRNKRSVWTVTPDPYPGAHFAVMPPELVRPCVLAGTSARGCCPACGAPWARVVERGESDYARMGKTGRDDVAGDQRQPGNAGNVRTANGTVPSLRSAPVLSQSWQPSCACPPAEPVGCVVLDPFAGSGTTLAVAREENRRAVGVELNPKYVELARRRLRNVTPALAFAEGETP